MLRSGRRVPSFLALVCAVVVSPRAAEAQASTSQDLLARIAALEIQLAELKNLVNAQRAASDAVAAADVPAAQPKADDGAFVDYLHDLKFGVGLDTYYGFNFNRPIGRVNLLRAYDVTSNNFALNQAGVVIESVPDITAGRRFGARVDLQYGQAT